MDRRESLALVAGAVAGLAGCNGLASGTSESSSTAPAEGATVTDGPASGTSTTPETALIRVGTDRPPVWLDDDGRPTPREGQRHIDSIVVDSRSRSDRLSLGGAVDSAAVESFVTATDFDAETVYVETVRVEECFRLDLCRISWQPHEVSTDYTRQIRPYDEACSADEWVFEARLVRIPDAIDAERVRGGSTSIGTGACDGGDARAEAVGERGTGSSTPRTNATTGGEQ